MVRYRVTVNPTLFNMNTTMFNSCSLLIDNCVHEYLRKHYYNLLYRIIGNYYTKLSWSNKSRLCELAIYQSTGEHHAAIYPASGSYVHMHIIGGQAQ